MAQSPSLLHPFGPGTLHVLLSFDLIPNSGSNGCLPATSPSPLPGLHQLEPILELELELIPQTLKVEARVFPKGKLEYCFTKKIERMR